MQEQQTTKIPTPFSYRLDQIDHQQQKPYFFTFLTPLPNTSYIVQISTQPTNLPSTLVPSMLTQNIFNISLGNKKQLLAKFTKCGCDEVNQLIKKYMVLNFMIEGFVRVNNKVSAFELQLRNKGKMEVKVFGINQLNDIMVSVMEQAGQIWSNYDRQCRGFDKKAKEGVDISIHIHPFLQYEVNCLTTPILGQNPERRIQEMQCYSHQFGILLEITPSNIEANLKTKVLELVNNKIAQLKANKPLGMPDSSLFSCSKARPTKIFNPHIYSKFTPKDKYELIMVKGMYEYYHYGDQNFNDHGWGCAYRALQTLISWLYIQGHLETMNEVPTITELQEKLDSIDRSRKLKGSNAWIGATEISWIVPTITTNHINCKILHVSNGKNILEKCEELKHHLLTSGCPIMYGGGEYAYSIVGMHYNWKMGECEFLILDPHYNGEDDFCKIQEKKGLAWRKPEEMFKPGVFYNFCMPIIK